MKAVKWLVMGAVLAACANPPPRELPPLPTQTKVRVAYADVEVPAISVPVTDETVRKRTVFDLLVKMRDPGLTIAELEALADRGRLGRGAITTLLDLSHGRPTPSIDELLAEIKAHRIF